MDNIFWIEYTMATGEAADSFIEDMVQREMTCRIECSRQVGQDNNRALTLKGEADAYGHLARLIRNRKKGEQDYAEYKQRTGQE